MESSLGFMFRPEFMWTPVPSGSPPLDAIATPETRHPIADCDNARWPLGGRSIHRASSTAIPSPAPFHLFRGWGRERARVRECENQVEGEGSNR